MRLLPIPGAPGYRIDCENQVAYRLCGYLKPLKDRTIYKKVGIMIDGHKVMTTIYRLMYCAQHNIDIMKIPSGTCIAMRNGLAQVVDRTEANNKKFITDKTKRLNVEKWKRNIEKIGKYYDGDTQPLLDELHDIELKVKWWFINTYGLSEERAEIVSAYGVNKFLDRLADGSPSPYIFGSVLKYGRGENARIARQRRYIDNMNVIEI